MPAGDSDTSGPASHFRGGGHAHSTLPSRQSARGPTQVLPVWVGTGKSLPPPHERRRVPKLVAPRTGPAGRPPSFISATRTTIQASAGRFAVHAASRCHTFFSPAPPILAAHPCPTLCCSTNVGQDSFLVRHEAFSGRPSGPARTLCLLRRPGPLGPPARFSLGPASGPLAAGRPGPAPGPGGFRVIASRLALSHSGMGPPVLDAPLPSGTVASLTQQWRPCTGHRWTGAHDERTVTRASPQLCPAQGAHPSLPA